MSIVLMETGLLLLEAEFMIFHSFSMYGYCRVMLMLEPVVTADHNTAEGFFIMQNV